MSIVDDMAEALQCSTLSIRRYPSKRVEEQNSIAKVLYIFGYNIDEIADLTGWGQERILSFFLNTELYYIPYLLSKFSPYMKDRYWRGIKGLDDFTREMAHSNKSKNNIHINITSGNSFKTEKDFIRVVNQKTRDIVYEEKVKRQTSRKTMDNESISTNRSKQKEKKQTANKERYA